MRKIIKINFPFLKIDFSTKYSKLEKMDELESLIMIMITTSSTTKLKKMTLLEGLKLTYNIQNWTMPIIRTSLNKLILSNTIKTQKNSDELLESSIGLIVVSIPKDIKNHILDGKFNKMSLNIRKKNTFTYENIIEGVSSVEDTSHKYNETEYDNKWITDPVSNAAINEIIDHLALQNINENETILDNKLNGSKVVYLEHTIEIEKKDLTIRPIDKLAQILFDQITDNKINIDLLTNKLNTSKDELNFYNNLEGNIVDHNPKIIKLGVNQYYIEDEDLYHLYNKSNKYKGLEIDKEFIINELYSTKIIDYKNIVDQLIESNDTGNLNLFHGSVLHKIEEFFIIKDDNIINKDFIKHILTSRPFINNINNNPVLFNKYFDEGEVRKHIMKEKSIDIDKNNTSINKFIINSGYKSLYLQLYNFRQVLYNKTTSIFPKWENEINFKEFLNELDQIHNKIDFIETKSDAESLMSVINKYGEKFTPIKSNIFDDIKIIVRKSINTMPLSKSEVIEHNGSKLRIIVEDVFMNLYKNKERDKKNKTNDSFYDKLNGLVNSKIISNKEQARFSKIYKNCNKFHHSGDVKNIITKDEEDRIKNDIKYVFSFCKEKKIQISQYQGVYKWATQ